MVVEQEHLNVLKLFHFINPDYFLTQLQRGPDKVILGKITAISSVVCSASFYQPSIKNLSVLINDFYDCVE